MNHGGVSVMALTCPLSTDLAFPSEHPDTQSQGRATPSSRTALSRAETCKMCRSLLLRSLIRQSLKPNYASPFANMIRTHTKEFS